MFDASTSTCPFSYQDQHVALQCTNTTKGYAWNTNKIKHKHYKGTGATSRSLKISYRKIQATKETYWGSVPKQGGGVTTVSQPQWLAIRSTSRSISKLKECGAWVGGFVRPYLPVSGKTPRQRAWSSRETRHHILHLTRLLFFNGKDYITCSYSISSPLMDGDT